MSGLEQIVERALPRYSSSLRQPPGEDIRESTPETGPGEGDDDDAFGDGRLQGGSWHGVSAIGSVSSGPIIEQLQSMMPHQRLTSEIEIRESISHLARLNNCSRELAMAADYLNAARSGDTRSLLAATKIIDTVRQYADPSNDALNPAGADGLALPTVLEDTSAAEKFKSLVQDCGVSPHKVSELLQDLPSRKHCDALVDYYFTSINWTRYPLNEADFRKSYQAVWATEGIGINPNHIKFLPLLFIVLAVAVRVAPSSVTGEERQRRLTSLRYYWSSRRSLLFAAAIHNDSVELVWVRLLSARFLTFDRRITESWSQLGAAVRTAQALGLHRDGKKMGLDNVQTQKRRRLWAYVYHADRSFALVMGRPQCIQDVYTSSLPPWNVDDEELVANTQDPVDNPLQHITPMTFVILRHQLAQIIGRICHHFQQVNHKSHYHEVSTLEEELSRFTSSLPPPFALEPDTSLDETHPYLAVHRFLVLTEIMFVRMSLHRPYILRRLDSDRFAKSRRACFDAAKKDFALRTDFRRVQPHLIRAMGVGYREFQTAMISGIALMLDPHGPDASDMKAILETFLADHRGMVDLDDTTRRELKIIEFLQTKSEVAKAASDGGLTSPTTTANIFPGDRHDLEKGQNDDRMTGPPLSSIRLTPIGGHKRFNSHSSPLAVVQAENGNNDSPPAASASPADEINPAQSLLDHWCDNLSNFAPADPLSGSMDNIQMMPYNGNLEFPQRMGIPPYIPSSNPVDPTGLEADLNYWETMFSMLPSNGKTSS